MIPRRAGQRPRYETLVNEQGRRQFRIGLCLGQGGYGDVYQATMRSSGGLEKIVALKVLREDVLLSEDALARLRDEGRLLARINHPVVVRAFDLTHLDGRVGLVTEFVNGDDLESCLRDPARIGVRATVQLVGQIASALDAAYTATDPDGQPLHIVHRDVKPSNVRIGRHGEVKLLDFGIARFQAIDRETHTVSDVMMGSVPYVSPERITERASLPAGDVFSLGCILYESLSRERFYRQSTLRFVSSICTAPEQYTEYLEERLRIIKDSREVIDIVDRCLRFDPAQRPTARELAITCEAVGDDLPGPTLRRWCSARNWQDQKLVDGALSGQIHTDASPTRLPNLSALSTVLRPVSDAIEPLASLPPATPKPPRLPRNRRHSYSSKRAAIGLASFGCLTLIVGVSLLAIVFLEFSLLRGSP